jgi:hypothetical protein
VERVAEGQRHLPSRSCPSDGHSSAPESSRASLDAPDDSLSSGVLKNVATGASKGAADIPGTLGNLNGLASYLLARGESAVTGKPLEQVQAEHAAKIAAANAGLRDYGASLGPVGNALNAVPQMSSAPTGNALAAPMLAKTGEYVPEGGLGRAVQSGVETAVGSLGPGVRGASAPVANALSRSSLLAPAVTGATGQVATDATGDPLVGMAASVLPGALGKIGGGATNFLSGEIQPETAQLATTARNFGIPIHAGQLSESPAVRFASSTLNRLPFSGAGADNAVQQTAFNRAVAQTLGENADKLTPTVMQNARARLGAEFDNVAKNSTINVDLPLVTKLHSILSDAQSVLPKAEVVPLYKQVQNFLDTVDPQTKTISGESYQALTRTGAPLDRLQSAGDTNIKYYSNQLRNALDDALQRSAPPQVQNALASARSQYKAMKTVEDLVEKSPTGDITPGSLMNEVRKRYGNMAYNGGGDLGDLARIGQRFLKDPPSSGTAERFSTQNWLSRVGGLGAGVGTAAFGLDKLGVQNMTPWQMVETAASIPASLAAGRALGAGLRSNALASRMINRSLGNVQPPGVSNELLNASVPYFARSGNALAERPPP